MRETTGEADVRSAEERRLDPEARGARPSDDEAERVLRAASRGVVSNVALALGSKAVALGSQVLITYYLDPAHLGLASLAVSTTSLAALLGGGALTTILIQKRAPDRETEGQAFWLALALSAASALLMLALAPAAVAGFHDGRLTGLIAIIAASGFVQGLSIVQSARLYARLRFGTLASIHFGMSLLQSGGALALAVAGLGPYAIVLPMLLSSAFGVTAYTVAAGRPPLVRPRLATWSPLLGATSWILAGAWASTLQRQGVGLVIGFASDAHVVGLFFWGQTLAAQAVNLLLDRLQSVLLSSLANIGDPTARSHAARRACRVLACVTGLLCLTQTIAAGPAIALVFPAKWHEAIPAVRALTLGLLAQPLVVLYQAILFSQARYRSFATMAAVFAVGQLAVCSFAAAQGGLAMIAAGFAGAAFSAGLGQGWIGYRALGLSGRDLLSDYLPPAATCAGCLLASEALLGGRGQALGPAAAGCVLATAAYLLLLWVWSYEGLRELVLTGQSLLQRLRRSRPGVESA